ncbi:hypothetical protein LJR296_007936 [Cupriavidus necator]|uniref:hypothetical protein n=1 Tax=Cupriavidus necator TaxID=106590 RepID=UPI003ECC7A52
MKKVLFVAAAIAMTSAAQAQVVFKPTVEAPVQGTHCELPSGLVLPLLNYDANGHQMQCLGNAMGEKPTWRYVAEGDSERIGRKLDQLNATNMAILTKLSELIIVQQASAHK